MRGVQAVARLLCILCCAGCASQGGRARESKLTEHHAKSDLVIVVSFDGTRHDYPDRRKLPTLKRLEWEGVRAKRLIPSFPAQTIPSHLTLATGEVAGVHGVIANQFRDPFRGIFDKPQAEMSWLDRMPVWIYAKKFGVETKVLEWPACGGNYRGERPSMVVPFTVEREDDARMEGLLQAIRVTPGRSQLLMAYFYGCDKTGHRQGPESDGVGDCMERLDALLGRLVDRIDSLRNLRTTLIVVSDHGMTQTKGRINVGPLIDRFAEQATILPNGPLAHVYVDQKSSAQEIERALRSLPHATVYQRGKLPEAWGYNATRRSGDFVVVGDLGWKFVKRALKGPVRDLGHHGRSGADVDMQSIFYAWGAGVDRQLVIDRAEAVDLVPTICALLGIPVPAGLQGRDLLH